MRRVEPVRRAIGLGVVLACVFGTMAVGTALKSPCAHGDFSNGRQYRLLCYTDIVPLLATEQLAGGRLPFFDRCQISENNCDEYPVLTMYLMRVAAWFSGNDYASFYYANAVLLLGFAMLTAGCVWLLGDTRGRCGSRSPRRCSSTARSTGIWRRWRSRRPRWSPSPNDGTGGPAC